MDPHTQDTRCDAGLRLDGADLRLADARRDAPAAADVLADARRATAELLAAVVALHLWGGVVLLQHGHALPDAPLALGSGLALCARPLPAAGKDLYKCSTCRGNI